jgi:hypothetical protein
MSFVPAIEKTIEKAELDSEFAGLLPERESLATFTLNIAPVITITPVIVVGSAIAVQAGTIASSVTASLSQWVTVP